MEEQKEDIDEQKDLDDRDERINTLHTRLNGLEKENEKLRKTVNDLNEAESNLQTELGQYKLNLERIKRERNDEQDIKIKAKDALIDEANELLESFNAEKHLIKAKIKKLLIEYCDLNEDSYQMNDDIDMDDYLVILEKELKVFTDRIRDESLDKISKILTDLESGKYNL